MWKARRVTRYDNNGTYVNGKKKRNESEREGEKRRRKRRKKVTERG